MKKIFWLVVIILIILAIAKVNTGGESLEVSVVDTEPIKIGAVISLTGVAADFGEMAQMAMEMAADEINQNGGINDRMVELYVEDDQTSPKDAVSAYRKVVDLNNVESVIGGLFDFVAQPLFPLNQNEQITFISPANFVVPENFEMNEHSFVMYPTFEKVINELESVIDEEEISQLAILRFQSDFGAEIGRVLGNITDKLGLSPLLTETYAEIGGTDFRTNILKLKSQNVDTVFLDMLDFDIINFLRRSRENSYNPKVIAYTTFRDVFNNEEVDRDMLEGIIMLDWEIPSDKFIKRFKARYGKEPRLGADRSYDAVYALAEAIANTNDKSEVANYLERNQFETVNSKFRFNDDHSVESTPVKVFEVREGELVEIKSNI